MPTIDGTREAGGVAGFAYDAVVLAGGQARRFGSDKLVADLAGRPVLDHALAAVGSADRVIVVGPRRATLLPVRWTREEPPGGGPVAGLAAGLGLVRAPHVLVLAGDMTASGPAIASLLQHAAGVGGSRVFVAVAPDGRLQPLLALWPTQLLETSVQRVMGQQRHAATALYDGVDVVHVTVPHQALHDVDVPEDLSADQ